jgi:UDP-GlcNAc3NAcA epimerase
MKILTVLGARPQFVKAATLSQAIREHNEKSNEIVEDIIVHTGQHFDHNMSQIFFDEMNITPPRYNFGINSATHGVMTGKMMIDLDNVMIKEKPDVVLVYGDTNSTLAGAICASKLHLPLAHVEAGLRSFNKKIPEEVNRLLTDRISDYLFCPSNQAVEWLKDEGITNNVFNSGDVMYDSTLHFSNFPISTGVEKILSEIKREFVVVTIHRAANTDNIENLKSIIFALNQISEEVDVIYLAHPRSKVLIEKSGINIGKIKMNDPLGYTDLLQLVKRSQCVLTDSGGLQKEAYFLQKPCVTLRDETEWMELIIEGVNVLTGANQSKIFKAFQEMRFKKIGTKEIYGDGKASKFILKTLLSSLG